MKKGRIVLVFWLLAVLAVVTSMASYAWVAMNTTALMRGFEVGLESDSLYLEISADREEDYGTNVVFNRTTVFYSAMQEQEQPHMVDLITCGQIPSNGALLLYPAEVVIENAYLYGTADGKYDPAMHTRFFIRSESEIAESNENFIEITGKLSEGDSILGYYIIGESASHYPTASIEGRYYYAKITKNDGSYGYACLGNKFEKGEKLAGRKYWGYANSSVESEAQSNNLINVVSMDVPTEDYALKKTVFLRGARGSGDLQDLSVSEVEILGRSDYLTNSIRVMFVATSGDGEVVSTIYSNRDPGSFEDVLFEEVLGNEAEVITVDVYIYFDGKDPDAHNTAGILNAHTVNVTFSVKDHVYN